MSLYWLYSPLLSQDRKLLDSNARVMETEKVGHVLYDMLGADTQGENDGFVIGGTTIDPKIKMLIWKGAYEELGTLAPRSDFKPKINVESTGSDLSQLSLAPVRALSAANIDEWRKWWCIFSMVYTAKYLKAGPQLFAYENKIYGFKSRYPNTYVWRSYDEKCRRLKASKPHQQHFDNTL